MKAKEYLQQLKKLGGFYDQGAAKKIQNTKGRTY